jgi:hypothetical protein
MAAAPQRGSRLVRWLGVPSRRGRALGPRRLLARQIEVLVPYGLRRRRPGWIVHESRSIRGVDLDELDDIPCTSVVRTILDLAAVAHPFRVAQALDHASRRWPGTLAAVDRRHAELRRKGRRGCRLMSDLLDERLGRGRYTDSDFESKTVRLVRSIGLPEPELQQTARELLEL